MLRVLKVSDIVGCFGQDERMQIALDDLDGRFKAILAILGVTDKYFPKTSDAASLDF